jgi:hypothetical protein
MTGDLMSIWIRTFESWFNEGIVEMFVHSLYKYQGSCQCVIRDFNLICNVLAVPE